MERMVEREMRMNSTRRNVISTLIMAIIAMVTYPFRAKPEEPPKMWKVQGPGRLDIGGFGFTYGNDGIFRHDGPERTAAAVRLTRRQEKSYYPGVLRWYDWQGKLHQVNALYEDRNRDRLVYTELLFV